MKASELENVPWCYFASKLYKNDDLIDFYHIQDNKGNTIANTFNERTAKAIASLPDTLKRLEELEDAARPILASWEHSDGTERLSELFLNLKKALEK